jgi:hypothetical protein
LSKKSIRDPSGARKNVRSGSFMPQLSSRISSPRVNVQPRPAASVRLANFWTGFPLRFQT